MEKKTLVMTLLGGGAILLAGIGSYSYFQSTPGSDPDRKAGNVTTAGPGGSFGSGTAGPLQPGGATGGGTPATGSNPNLALPSGWQSPGSLALSTGAAPGGGTVASGGNAMSDEEKAKRVEMMREKRDKFLKATSTEHAKAEARRREVMKMKEDRRKRDPSALQMYPDIAVVPEERVIYPEGEEKR